MIIDLSFKEIPVGTQVKTKKGFIFTKLGQDHWRDETAQLDWLLGEKTNISQYDAEKIGALPTREQFREAEEHGIREILDMRDKWYWSSTLYQSDSGSVYAFDSYGGNVDYIFKCDSSDDDIAARFVSEVKK